MTIVRKLRNEDIQEVHALEKAVWGKACATSQQILSRHSVFPDGSIVVQTHSGEIVGYAAAQKVNSLSMGSWDEQTDNGLIKQSHRTDGKIAYGVGMSGLPSAAKLNIARLVIDYYRKLFITDGGCELLALGSRAPGYAKWKKHHGRKFTDYLRTSRNGYSIDPELRLYQRHGFSIMWGVEGYFSDFDSADFGVMIGSR